jgi:hypothetical protein
MLREHFMFIINESRGETIESERKKVKMEFTKMIFLADSVFAERKKGGKVY